MVCADSANRTDGRRVFLGLPGFARFDTDMLGGPLSHVCFVVVTLRVGTTHLSAAALAGELAGRLSRDSQI